MDDEIQALERAVRRRGPRYAALVSRHAAQPLGRPRSDEAWDRVTLVGFLGHEGCLVSQVREHYWITSVHTVAAVAALERVHGIIDLCTRSAVSPTRFPWYMWDLEDGWTELTDRPDGDADERHSSPYRPIERLWERPDGFRGPMHEELAACHARFLEARTRYAESDR